MTVRVHLYVNMSCQDPQFLFITSMEILLYVQKDVYVNKFLNVLYYM
jgi:hypothetical protein